MRRVVPLAVVPVVLGLGASPVASAAEPSVYKSLPQGKIAPPPTDKPPKLTAADKVKGMWVVPPSQRDRQRMAQQNFMQTQIFGTEEAAKTASHGGFVEDQGNTCFAQSDGHFDGFGEKVDWSPNAQTSVTLFMQKGKFVPRSQTGVQAVHAEQLVGEGDNATLEMQDAWVDVESGGARLIGKSSMPLKRVGTGPSGLEVYAAREEGTIHFVIRPPKPPKDASVPSFLTQQSTRLVSQADNDFRVGQSSCGHLRVSLPVARDDGASATVQATILSMPPADDPDHAAEKAPKEDAKAPPEHSLAGIMFGSGHNAQQQREALHKRSLAVHLSASQTSAEPDPVVSVSMGWASKESEQPF